ncbi:ABZJ_00895 family protein [Acinetobacter pragensis]
MNMKKYIVYFSICYAAAMALIAIIVSFFDLSGGTSAACLIAAGFATAMKFAQDQRRPPNSHEKKQLIWGCLFASIVISIIASAMSLLIFFKTSDFFSILGTAPIWIWIIAILLTIFIHYLILSLSFGWFAKRSVRTGFK